MFDILFTFVFSFVDLNICIVVDQSVDLLSDIENP